MAHKVFLALGSNIGNRRLTMIRAMERLEEVVGTVERFSELYETEPEGFASDNKFLNGAVLVDTELSPREVLERTQMIEKELGRTTKSQGGEYHDRTIDIDILLYDDLKVDEPDLQIPHPRMYNRDFVMTPLREIL